MLLVDYLQANKTSKVTQPHPERSTINVANEYIYFLQKRGQIVQYTLFCSLLLKEK